MCPLIIGALAPSVISNCQALVESLKKRDNIIQKQFDRQDAWLACHCLDIKGCQQDINQHTEDQVKIIARMSTYEERACHCGSNSEHLSNMSYGEPLVAGSLGFLFQGGKLSSHPLPIPPPTTSFPAADVPVPSLGSSDLDKENSSLGSFQSTQQIVTDLVEVVEVDPAVDNKEARVLLDVMDAEVRSRLFQHRKSKKHPHHFVLFPKGWKADCTGE